VIKRKREGGPGIYEYQIMLDRCLIMFNGVPAMLSLKLAKTRMFRNGRVHLCYEPAE